MRQTFCKVNAHVVQLDKLIEDLQRFKEEATVAGYFDLACEIDEDRRMWITGKKE